MTAPGQFVTGLTDKQLQVFEDLASDYMVELLTQIANMHAAAMLERAGLTAAADPLIPPDTPPPTPPPTAADFAAIPSQVSAAIAQNIVPLVVQAYVSGGGVIRSNLVDLGATDLPHVHSIDAENYLRTAQAGYYDWIGDDLLHQVRTGLADGLAAGESIPELADRVKAAAGTTARQATLTARTSVIAANNRASIDVMSAASIDGTEKEWLATDDLRTRPAHIRADGQRVPLDGLFKLTEPDAECDHPGEFTLPSAQRDNCRCTVGYVIPDRVIGPTGGAHAQYSGNSLARSYVEGDITHSELVDAMTNPPEIPGHLGKHAAKPKPRASTPVQAAQDLIPIRQSLAGAGSLPEIEAAFEAEASRITGRAVTADFTGSAMATAQEHAEGILRVLERFPDAELDSVVTTALPGRIYAQAGGGVIEFDAGFASEAGRADYLADLARGADPMVGGVGRWSVQGSANPASVAIHEMGHILGLDTLGGTVNAEAERIVAEMAAREGVAKDLLIRREVSIYGATDTDELLAEAMSDVVLNGSGASELSQELMSALEMAYKDEGRALVESAGRIKPMAADPLARMKVAELRALARENGVEGFSLMTKPQLLARLTELGVQAPTIARVEIAALADLTPAVRRRLSDLLTQVGERNGESFGFGNLQDLQRLEARGLIREQAGTVGEVINGRVQMTESKWFLTDEGKAQLTGTVEAAAPDLAKMKVAELRTLAKERGVTLPPKAVKKDIIEALRAAETAPKVEEVSTALVEARARQAAIDSARSVADLTARVFEGLGSEVDLSVLRRTVEQTAARLKTSDKVRNALLRAIDSGDVKRIERAADKVARDAGLTRVGSVETEVPFVRAQHEAAAGADLRAGDMARIIRPGYSFTYNGETIQLSKAAVEEGLTREETIANAKRVLSNLGAGHPTPAQLRAVGIKRVGVASDRAVKFDPAKYEVRGGATVPPGAKVRVIEPGYTTVYRGQVVEISKPVVEVIPEVRSASAATLKKIMKMSDDQAQAEFATAIDGEYAGGIRAEVTTTRRIADYGELDDGTYYDATEVSGKLYDAKGSPIGQFQRVFYNGDEGFEAHHELLMIDPKFQGSGFASDFNANLYDWYRRSGVKRVTVYADIDVGGYTWATQGFDFVSYQERRDFFTYRLDPVVDKIAGRGTYSGKISKADYATLTRKAAFTYDEFMAQLPLFDAVSARVAAGEEVSAYELSQLGRKPGQGRDDWWIGKVLMMGSHWNGLRLV